jgi:tRNA-uridine 2-sulfurtransferase
MPQKKIVVGMSGGVDSSVTAQLLKEQGHEVIGLFMKNWEDTTPDGQCHVEKDFEDVKKVCEKIGIPYYPVNFVQEYQEKVFKEFLDELKAGYTPNPDILCNKEIKFNVFLKMAEKLGADFLATGHYARIGEDFSLLKGSDPTKDQSYFLYTLDEEILKKVLFPIGHLEKKILRDLARASGLPTAEKKDSTGICFVGKRNFAEFIGKYLPYEKGPIIDIDTKKQVGAHQGVAYYTLGQRKGLRIGGKGNAWFVVDKDVKNNILYVGQGENHPALFSHSLTCSHISWVHKTAPQLPCLIQAKIRYRQEDQSGIIEKIEEGVATVNFLQAQRAITPCQAIVFYEGNRCLGGGKILSRGPSLFEIQEKPSLLSVSL